MKNFLIYRSSAGSGKTYTLVKEYLKLVLTDPDNFRSTLAVTFTNKAAEEMKTRIVSSLIKLSKDEDNSLKELLASEGVKGNIPLQAARVLQRILHQYSYFSILTIDSFFLKIIRSFAKELKLQLGYDIELDLERVLDKIVNDMLDGIETNSELRKYIEEYVFYSIEDNKGWRIENRIKDAADEIFRERYWIKKGFEGNLADSREKMSKFIRTLCDMIDNFEDELIILGQKALKFLNENSLDVSDFKQHTAAHFVKISNRTNFPEKINPVETIRQVYLGTGKWFTQKSLIKDRIIRAADSGLQQMLEEAITYHDTNYKKYITARELIKTVYVLGIFKDILDKLKDYRDENRLMLISDINTLLTKVISGESSPFIYEKIGNVYKHFLIDEFQDTSTYQWMNFLPLIENSLGENNFSMIVGDVKQSIYRWRSGNMELLLKGVNSDLAAFREITEEKTLDRNYRSRKEIIQFNNEFFKNAAQILSEKIETDEKNVITDSYKDVQQNCEKSTGGGYVEVNFIDRDDESRLNPREISINKTIDIIKNSLNLGYNQRDIMVLVRTKSDGNEAANYLIQAGFRVVSSESMILTNSPAVRLLLNLLKYIIDPEDRLARTEILYNYLRFFNEDIFKTVEMSTLFNDHKKYSDSLFYKTLPEEFFSRDKNHVNGEFFSLSLYETIECLVRIFKLNSRTDIYLLRFLDVVKEYISKNNSDINAFIDWWKEKQADFTIVVPDSEDAIRIMTIHKAKGLESPVVILPYCIWEIGLNAMMDKLWVSGNEAPAPFNDHSAFFVKASGKLKESFFEKDYIEEAVLTYLDNLNLLYVAFTRAINALYINIPYKSGFYHTGKLISSVLDVSLELNNMLESMKSRGINEYRLNGDRHNENAYVMNDFTSSGFRKSLLIKAEWKGIKFEKAIRLSEMKNRGIILHRALANIKLPGDLDEAAYKLVTEGLITTENLPSLRKELEEILNTEDTKKWFTEDFTIMNEAEILLPGGEIYRPDRVMLGKNEVIIVDYKSGSEKAEHKEQLDQYAEVMKEMGYQNIEKYLFYIMQRKAVRVK
ncbi:MAG: UvrD-helicase domain-containing protein [Ignavibacteria bacterium]